VEANAASASEAQSAASDGMRAVLAAASRYAQPGDISTRTIALEPVYDYRESGARLTGYRASQSLGVRLRQLDQLGPLIDAAVEAGATGVNDVSLGLADAASAEAEALALAVSDARARAAQLAEAAGVRLGALLALSTVSAAQPPRPMMRMAAAELAGTPIAEGSAEVIVEVVAAFAIEA
jgi:uncharacterized protein YggE